MKKHDWIVGLLADLHRYAKLNGLMKLELELARVKVIAEDETSSVLLGESGKLPRLNVLQ